MIIQKGYTKRIVEDNHETRKIRIPREIPAVNRHAMRKEIAKNATPKETAGIDTRGSSF